MKTAEEFHSRVVKSDGCWEWAGAHLSRPGGRRSYGSVLWDSRRQTAHRVMWQLTNGSIPKGLWVLHICDNQGCIRPDHLYLGTHSDNTRDAIMRHRMAVGEFVGVHKLTELEVIAIRAMAAAGVATETIGPIFGVTGRAARQVVSRQHWKHL